MGILDYLIQQLHSDCFISDRLDNMEIADQQTYKKLINESNHICNKIEEMLCGIDTSSLVDKLREIDSRWQEMEVTSAYKQGLKDAYELFEIVTSERPGEQFFQVRREI